MLAAAATRTANNLAGGGSGGGWLASGEETDSKLSAGPEPVGPVTIITVSYLVL